jgi:hypothetical protein
MENTPQVVCQASGGAWDERDASEIPQCQLGCCVIADQAAFVPLVRCKRLSTFFGVSFDYRKDVTSEVQCIATAQSQDIGACVYEDNFDRTCKFTTRKECGAQDGVIAIKNSSNGTTIQSTQKTFYKDYLCSAEALGTNCARQATTSCRDGKVYWIDSCGNKENVYSSDKAKSWNNGRVAEPDKICAKNDGSNKDCGNCEYLLGARCAPFQQGILGTGRPSFGDNYCKKTDCTDGKGNTYKNGESWCYYDASTGNGTDPVGSRQYKYYCSDGKIEVEACADYRQQVCISGSVAVDGINFKTAACRQNRWQDCAAQVKKNDCSNTDRRDCAWLPPITGLNLGGSADSAGSMSNPTSGQVFSNPAGSQTFTNPASSGTVTGKAVAPITGNAIFGGGDESSKTEEKTSTNRPDGVCVPDIPPGLKFWQEGDSQSQCSLASSKCIVTYEIGKFSGKQCVGNCECINEDWALAMNRVCMSLGDCGAKTNFIGKVTEDGYEWKSKGKTMHFSPNNINKIISMQRSGMKSEGLNIGFGTVALGAGAVGLVAAFKGAATTGFFSGSAPSVLPNLAGMATKSISGAGGGSGLSSLTSNWLASGAFNALLIGAIVWGGAKMFGASSQKASALGSAATIGLMAGSFASRWASSKVASLPGSIVANEGNFVYLASDASTPIELSGATTNTISQGIPTTLTGEGGISAQVTLQDGNLITNSITQQSWWAQNAGLVNLAVTVGVAILVYLYMNRETKTETVTFTCMPWQPPRGGSECEKCNDDERACSEYRCRSLGGTCELVNAGTSQEKCVNINPKDTNPPVITPNPADLTYGYKYTDVKTSPPGPGFKIVGNTQQCVKAFTPLKFGITTDEPSQCKIDINHTAKFDDMQYWFGGSNLYMYNHTEQMVLPGAKDLQNVSGLVLKNGNEATFYVRCRDRAGEEYKSGGENLAEYAVRFCVDPTPDTTAPQIKATSIESGGCVAQNQDNVSVDFYVDKPSDCRWSKTDDSYDNMKNTMSCSSGIYQMNALQLYPCTALLTGVSKESSEYYVRCKSYPEKNESDRTKNEQSYKFSLRGSNSMKLKSVTPNATTIFGGTRPAQVELSAQTLFGCDDGKSICYYSTTGAESSYIQFFNTNDESGISTQPQDLYEGSHKYFIKCVDSGGNVVKETVNFNVEIDTNAPVVARVYNEGGKLKIVTVRNSECAYSFNNCDFTFQEGQEMPYANTTMHLTDWRIDRTYYIKCRDQFRTEDSDCSIVVKPYQNFV